MAEVIITPRRREDFFDLNGEPTHRFIRWVESVTQSNNENTQFIDTVAAVSAFSTQEQQSRRELLGLPEFTVDATGFTTL